MQFTNEKGLTLISQVVAVGITVVLIMIGASVLDRLFRQRAHSLMLTEIINLKALLSNRIDCDKTRIEALGKCEDPNATPPIPKTYLVMYDRVKKKDQHGKPIEVTDENGNTSEVSDIIIDVFDDQTGCGTVKFGGFSLRMSCRVCTRAPDIKNKDHPDFCPFGSYLQIEYAKPIPNDCKNFFLDPVSRKPMDWKNLYPYFPFECLY